MTEVLGSFDRTYQQPMLRPRNKNLNLIVAPSKVMNHYYYQDKLGGRRSHNKEIGEIGYRYTEYQRSPNDQVVKMENQIEAGNPLQGGALLSGATLGMGQTGDNLTGGAVKNAGWDPKHPRLSRDPTWYPGRGKEKAVAIMKTIGNVALEALPELL